MKELTKVTLKTVVVFDIEGEEAIRESTQVTCPSNWKKLLMLESMRWYSLFDVETIEYAENRDGHKLMYWYNGYGDIVLVAKSIREKQ